jgi:hypothetical protein
MPRKPVPPSVVPVSTGNASAAAAPAAAEAVPAVIAKSATSHLFARSKEERRSALTHEQIASDLDAFARSGGKIEVLGTTFTFKSIKAGPLKPSAATEDASKASSDPPSTPPRDPQDR